MEHYLTRNTQLICVGSLTMDHNGKFMVHHTFQNEEFSIGDYRRGPENTINGIQCWIICCKKSSYWECCLGRMNYVPSLGWKIKYKIRTNNGVETVGTRDGKIEAMTWICFRHDPKYFVDGNMTIECHAELYEVDKNGIRKPPTAIENKTARLFDESVKEFSDVVLIVEDKKFYVNKMYLASESSYFKSLFIGSFEESKKDEISLKDVEAKYFQLFLESLYGDPVINDETVGGILKLADMFEAKRVILKCKFYLIKNSKKCLKEKLDLAVKFNLSELKESCLKQIQTVNDIRSVMSDNPKEMDPDVLAFPINDVIQQHNNLDLPANFMLSHSFRAMELSKGYPVNGPTQTINGIDYCILCRKMNESNWQCWLGRSNYKSLVWKLEFKIRTKNGVETVGTTDGRIEQDNRIPFRNDPKYFVNGNMTIECHVEVYEVDKNGIRIPPRLFDESVKEFSDVVLVVEEKKFYVNKLYLASESSYFKSLLIGSFEESKKDEISLKDVAAIYFQLFLESLYGDRVINDGTVDGILILADMFDAQWVRQKCEVYLVKESRKSLKEKLDFAVKFNSSGLKESCLNRIKTVKDIRAVMSKNPKEMDHDVLAFLCDKLLQLSK